jgi:hypothetical protein
MQNPISPPWWQFWARRRVLHHKAIELQRSKMIELQGLSNEDLFRLPRIVDGTIINFDGKTLLEMIWRDSEKGADRVIVQHYDKAGSWMAADGFVIERDGSRRPLTEQERRLYL